MRRQRSQAHVEICSPDGSRETCLLEYASGNQVEMTASCALLGTINVTSSDLFEALNQIRLATEEHGYFMLCNGARKDAYPSRMSRQMGKSGKVYLFKNGLQARKEDLVDLLAPAALDQVTTVSQQRKNYEEWLNSLGSQ
jgi:hypothetical protein